MLEMRGELDLAEEPVAAEGEGYFAAEDLDGDGAIEADVPREVDDRHSPFTELALDVVASGKSCPDALEGIGDRSHRCVPLGK